MNRKLGISRRGLNEKTTLRPPREKKLYFTPLQDFLEIVHTRKLRISRSGRNEKTTPRPLRSSLRPPREKN